MREVVLYPGDDGCWVVECPSLPGCISYGKNLEEAKKMIKDAIELYLKSLQAHKEPIPNDDQGFMATVDVKSPRLINAKLKYA